jgi:diguanylate cyclase (GGDEF)-like protein
MRWPWARRTDSSDQNGSKGTSRSAPGQGGDQPGQGDELALLTDGLTSLRNRFDLKDRLDREVAGALPFGPRPALLLLDLDDFRQTNDAHGPRVGDAVLKVMSGRLVDQLSPHETAYRIGGDEFAVVVDRTTPEDAVALAGILLSSMATPVDAGSVSVRVTTSIGVVMLGHRDRSDAVLRDADLTVHRAKAEGGNRVDIYSGELDYWALSRKRDFDALAREVEELRLEKQALTEAIMIDPRTGLPNAAAFDADHLQAHARRIRSEERYAILLADIDGFRDYSENAPAAMTGETLRVVAQTIKATVRQGDRAYRYGWQEFMVLLPGADLRDAVVAAERIRSKVASLAIEHPTNPSGLLTVTVGAIEAGFRHQTTKEVVVEVADLLLKGKLGGRNRIVWPH